MHEAAGHARRAPLGGRPALLPSVPCAHARALPHPLAAAANNTWWNVHSSSRNEVGLPPCSFGPLLNFFGYWKAPGAGKTRRLLGVERQLGTAGRGDRVAVTSLTAGTVTSMDVGAAAPAPAEDGSGAGDRATALAVQTGWCTSEGWWVEQVGSGKGAWPPNLHVAQAAERKAGRMK